MTTPTARPTHCRHCGSAIWQQTVPFTYRVDTDPLRSVTEELVARLYGRQTYQVFRTGTTFELVQRATWNLDGDYETKIVLADHTCHRLTVTDHPNYWPTVKGGSSDQPNF